MSKPNTFRQEENVTVLNFFKKILIIPKMSKMGNFWVQNQHFLTFLYICSLDFSEIRSNDRDQKVGKSAGSKF